MKWPYVSRKLYEQALAASAQFLHDKQIAEDRLYAAWKDNYTIPPRQSVEPRTAPVIELLPEKLRDEINNWESPEVRADLEREARRLLFDLKYPEERILQIWGDRRGVSASEATS